MTGSWGKNVIMAGLLGVGAVALMAATTSAPATVPDDSAKPAILSHRAFYKMELDSARNTSTVRGVGGGMYFSWQDACDGWTVEQHLDLAFTHEEAEETRLSSVYTTWESKDGTRYRFNYRKANNGQQAEELRGTASLDRSGGSGTAHYTVPEAKDVDLPAGTYFPTAHTMVLVEAAQAHKPMVSATVFDGTDEEGLSQISAVIGAGKPLMTEVAKTGLGADVPAQAWPVRMAFFPLEDSQAEPDYEMDTNLLANGVSEFMIMDYGEFKLRGTLEKVEIIPKPDC